MTTDECLDENALAGYIEQVLPPDARARAERHIDTCEECAALVAGLARTHHGPVDGAAPDPAVTASGVAASLLAKGTQVGRFLVIEPVGTGAMGIVYAAYDPSLDRRVAIKLLHPDAQSKHGLTQATQRLLREAQAIARLSHPNVVTVYEFGTHGDSVFLAMEFVEGITLREWCEAQRPWREVVRQFLFAGRGLVAAHAAGLVHRDFKPANVLVGNDGRVRVADFGLVHTGDAHNIMTSLRHGMAGNPLVTGNGLIVGTPAYMAPEQLRGDPVDHRADQFSFCVSLYEALYGTRPYPGALGEALDKMVRHELAPPKKMRGPLRLRRVLYKGLSPDPVHRYGSMTELLAALQAALGEGRLRVATQVGALVVLVGLLVALVSRDKAQLCSGAQSVLRSTWSPEVSSALLASLPQGVSPDGRESVKRLMQLVDRHAARWVSTHQEVCEATRVRREQPESVMALRMACLDRRRREVAALVETVRDARPELLERAADLARVLRPLEECDVAEVVARQSVAMPPPKLADRVHAVREELARIEAMHFLSAEDALEPARAAAARARLTGFLPVEAEALTVLGALQSELRRYAESEATLVRAAHAADRAGHDDVRLRALVQKADVLGMRQRKFAEADAALADAEAVLDRMGRSAAMESEFTLVKGLVRFQARRYAEAEALFREALTLRERLYGADDPRTLVALIDLAQALKGRGAFAEAAQVARRARDILKKSVGPRHTLTVTAEVSLGSILFRMGDARGALDAFEAANARAAPASARDAATRIRFVDTLVRLGQHTTAEEHLRDVQAWLRDNAQPSDPLALYGRSARFRVLQAVGRHAEAVETITGVERTLAAERGEDSLELAGTRAEMVNMYLELGDAQQALKWAEPALAVSRQGLGEDHPDAALVRAMRGEALVKLGRREEGANELQAALTVQQRVEPDPMRIARTRVALAEVLAAEPGQIGRVRALLDAAAPALREPWWQAVQLRSRADVVRAQLER